MYEKSLVDDIAYQNIVSSLNYQEEFAQICVFAEKIEKEKSISCIFMLSESSFTVFTQKAILKFYSISETRSCFEITRVYSEKDDEFVLFFQNNFSLKFFTSQTKHILEIIVQHVHNILADTEMPEVDLESFDYTILRHSGYSSLMRFRARVFNENFVINNRINDIYMQFLDSKKNLLDLRIFPDVQHVTQLLLDSVNCEPMIDSIQIPNSFSCWSELSYFFKRNTTIKSLIVSQPPDHLFPFFVQSLRNNPLNKLKQIIFVKTRFDEEQIRQLIEFLKRSKIERLGLRESINHHNSALFMNTLSEEIHATNIKSLDFDNTKSGLNLRQLFIGGSRGIEELSVQNCKIQLAEIFEFLDESSIIKKVDMSGNRCEHLIDDKIQISESLEKIKVANILFGEDNFNRLMKVLCKFKGNVNLSRSILDRERWEHLFTSLHQSENCQISVIHWDDNPISLKFLDFLDSCVNLKKLSLSGCFGSDDLIFNDVVEFLKWNDTLKTIKINATRKNHLNSNSVFKLIQILRVNRSLTKFLIYYQEMNENTLIELVNSLMVNRVINFVGFSARNMKKFAEVFGAFGILITRGASLKISIRNADFLAFLKGDEKLQKKREFFDLIHEIERGNKIVEIPEECIKWKEKRPKILRVPMKIENAPTVIGEDWSILQPEIPAIDNTDILKSLKSRFSYLIAQSQ